MDRSRLLVATLVAAMTLAFVTDAGAQGDAARAQAGLSSVVGTMATGMGGAFVAVANDGTALYWNPAALASHRGIRLYTSFGGASENIDTVDELLDLADILEQDEGPLSTGDFDIIRDVARRNDNVPVEGNAGFISAIELGNFALGTWIIGGVDAVLDYSSVADVSERVDFTAAGGAQGGAGLAYGRSLGPQWDVGVCGRLAGMAVARGEGYASHVSGEEPTLVNPEGDGDTDTSFTVDVGVIYAPDDRSRWALVGRNVTNPSFDMSLEGTEGPTTIEMDLEPSVDAGYCYTAPDGAIIAVDVHNVTEANDVGSDLAVGMAVPLSSSASLRLGYGDGLPTLGLGLRLGGLRLEAASALDWKDRVALCGAIEF